MNSGNERGDAGMVILVLFLIGISILSRQPKFKDHEHDYNFPTQTKDHVVYTVGQLITLKEQVRFEKMLIDSKGKEIHLRIESYGGSAEYGFMMLESLQDFIKANGKDSVRCYVPRLAASMAAILALACPRLGMDPGAHLLFHSGRVFMPGGGVIRAVDIDLRDPDWRGWRKVKQTFLELDKRQVDMLVSKTGLERYVVMDSLDMEDGWVMNRFTACQFNVLTECEDMPPEDGK